MTNHRAEADVAEPVGEPRSWRYSGRRNLLAVVPVLDRCIHILRARDSLHSSESDRASLDQQLDRHDEIWTCVPSERLFHRRLVLVHLRPRNLSQRGGREFHPTAISRRQLATRACTTTCASFGRDSAASPVLDSYLALSGRRRSLAPLRRVTALKAALLHGRGDTPPSLELNPNGRCSILQFHVLVSRPTEGTILRRLVNSLNTSRASVGPLSETWSAR